MYESIEGRNTRVMDFVHNEVELPIKITVEDIHSVQV